MKKKLISLLLCCLFLAAAVIPATALQEEQIIETVMYDGDWMQILCADPQDSSRTYTLKLEDQKLEFELRDVQSEDIPVTLLCLVDLSQSKGGKALAEKQQALSQISDRMGSADEMVIAKSGKEVMFSAPLDSADQRKAEIEALAENKDPSCLYSSIVSCLSKLDGESGYHDFKALVILSDGLDDDENGTSQSEVMAAIADIHVPVFTVAISEDGKVTEQLRTLGSFARASYGGIAMSNTEDQEFQQSDINGSEYGEVIWSALQTTDVLRTDLNEMDLDRDQKEQELTVKYSTDSVSYSETTMLLTEDIPEPEGEDSGEKDEKNSYVPYLIGGAIAIVAVVILVVILACRKKPEPEEENHTVAPPPMYPDPFQNIPADPISDYGPTEPVTDSVQDYGPTTPDLPQAAAPDDYVVHLVSIPYGKFKLQFPLSEGEEVSFGRSAKAQIVLNAQDPKLSGRHFSLILRAGCYSLRDDNSRNGTWLNGVAIDPGVWMKFESGDKIRAGENEYRITVVPKV